MQIKKRNVAKILPAMLIRQFLFVMVKIHKRIHLQRSMSKVLVWQITIDLPTLLLPLHSRYNSSPIFSYIFGIDLK